MKILVHMGHPGHFHLFKNAIRELEKRKHKILITAFKKDVLIELLENNGFPYHLIGEKKKGIINKIFNSFKVYLKLFKIISKFRPDFTLSIGSPYVAPVAKIFGVINIAFNDTEHANEQRMLYLPFTNIVATPSCYLLDLGRKQLRYDGYHELAYLHPNWFKPDSSVLDELKISKRDKFVIVRFISWSASHDVGQVGFSKAEKFKLIKKIEEFATPIITSEGKLPQNLRKYQIKIPPHKIHDFLYYANMYVGEGGTMATEAALIGTPNILINPLAKYCGNHIELSEKYKIQVFFDSVLESQNKLIELLNNKKNKEIWKNRLKKLIKEKIDLTNYMINLIEKYYQN